jgi:hypothetical protein
MCPACGGRGQATFASAGLVRAPFGSEEPIGRVQMSSAQLAENEFSGSGKREGHEGGDVGCHLPIRHFRTCG